MLNQAFCGQRDGFPHSLAFLIPIARQLIGTPAAFARREDPMLIHHQLGRAPDVDRFHRGMLTSRVPQRENAVPKKTTDPFMATLWSAMLEEKLPPGGHETSWGVTSPRIRNRFIRAVRDAMQTGAALQASMVEKTPVEPPKIAGAANRKRKH